MSGGVAQCRGRRMDERVIIDNTEDRLLVVQLYGGCQRSIGCYGNMTSYSPEQTLII
jgi:hypothetical protein